MNQLTDQTVSVTAASSGGRGADRDLIDFLVRALIKLGIRNEDFGYHLLRASMVIMFFFFWVSEMVPVRGGAVDLLYQ